ncbi:VOC family protein [Streptomyces althioticus]|uniref:VOC family protein n=1 Tax=Streptomyces althioticus TaxID=83380 RepID=UPI003F540EFB
MAIRRTDDVAVVVDDLDDAVARLRRHGAEPVGEVVRYGNACRLCRLCQPRGPSGVLVALAGPPAGRSVRGS